MKFRVRLSKDYNLEDKEKEVLTRLFGMQFIKKSDSWLKCKLDLSKEYYVEVNSLEELLKIAEELFEKNLALDGIREKDILIISKDKKTGEWILEVYNDWRE